jgi:DNA topoisomerase-1
MKTRKILINYWLSRQFGGKRKWESFEHNGVLFPPEYIPHNIPIKYNGQEVQLEPQAEEYATLYAKYIETEYINNKIFNKNFWEDWKKILGKDNIIQSLENCDFSLINNYIIKEKEKKLALSKEKKEELTKEREQKEAMYKTAVVDGKQQPVGNFRMEPPGIFIGRGCHPKLGKIKQRIRAEDITINIGKESKIPEGNWKSVIHERSVEWLASWKDNITGKIKYVWLGNHSDFKAQSDMHKFEKARKLKKKINTIREINTVNLLSTDLKMRQIATALYFIDNLALRVGNEKGSDEADTVGVTSLRVEHIDLRENNEVVLDFLGKDSVRYKNKVQVSDHVYKNLQDFKLNKKTGDSLFDKIVSNDLNKYLQTFMDGLSGKVFRTVNSCILFQKELDKASKKYEKIETSEEDKINELLDDFNKANAKVALMCNHQKNISKSFDVQQDKLNNMIKKMKSKLRKAKESNSENKNEKIEKYKAKLNKLKAKKILKLEMKNVSLGTSKDNYIDPRITIAFMKRHNLPIDIVFSKTQQEKFKWAFDINSDFKF